MKAPVVFIIFKRIDTTKKVFKLIHSYKPNKLYLVADGPKTIDDNKQCSEVRNFIENNIDWDCELIKVYSNTNLGCAKRVQTGLDYVFEFEDKAIILEDDTLPDPSFFKFCEELLERYKDDAKVAHISGCNLYPDVVNLRESYCFSSIVNIWGWATWKRAWKNYDIKMLTWKKINQSQLLDKFCVSSLQQRHLRKMFDLHCDNNDPWTWDSQWVYTCWKMDGLSIMPSKNLVSNIGIGPNASNTKSLEQLDAYPKINQTLSFPLVHPKVILDKSFDLKYFRKSKISNVRKLRNLLKSILNRLFA